MKKIVILVLLLSAPLLHATFLVPIKGYPAGNNITFAQPIQATVFDRTNGTFYVGLGAGAGTYGLSALYRAYGNSGQFVGIGTGSLDENRAVEFLTLATSIGNPNPVIGAVVAPGAPLSAVSVIATTKNGLLTKFSNPLNDASGTLNNNGSRTNGIVGLAANQLYMFAAVKPCGGDFGDCYGGIASVSINQSNLSLTQVPANATDNGIKAKKLDPMTPEIIIGSDSPAITPNKITMYWDDPLQRLYIGLQVTTPGTAGAGMTCPVGTAACNTGILLTCPTGFQADFATLECVTCPSGGYFDTTFNSCQLCPTGQLFNPSAFACQTQTCSAGYFFNTNPSVLTCQTCPTGWTSNGITCFTCTNGGYFNPNVGQCIACASGMVFDPTTGGCITGPKTCGSGQVLNANNLCVTVIDCPPPLIFDPLSATCITPSPGSITNPTNSDLNGFFPQPLDPFPATTLGRAFALAGPIGADQILRSPTSGARSVISASVDDAGVIAFAPIAPNTAFATENLEDMVGVVSASSQTLTINTARVLHASTGPSYLIINGGLGDNSTLGGTISALPLVDLGDPTNPTQGTIANKNSALVNFKFVTPAMNPPDMPQNTDAAVMVGTGPVTVAANDVISDIQVIGDTVYVSVNNTLSVASDSGILYSQAMFDETGKIIRWTPWTKKALPPYNTSSQNNVTAVSFFAVDAALGKVIAVDGQGTQVVQTAWNTNNRVISVNGTFSDISLVGTLNNALNGNASTAVLDLDQSTRGFLSNQSRYALFAGDVNGSSSVLFTRVSQTLGSTVDSPQTVTTDFSMAKNFLVSPLPNATCQVLVLEYARQLTGTSSNYFFAGTQNGLFVFSVSGNGFDVATMSNLNAAPFTTGSWQLAPTISGAIVDIKTTGNMLYVITQTPATATTPMQSSLYRIPFATTVSAMFAPGNITLIAQTGTDIFSSISLLSGLQIISTTSSGSTEQVVLGTNNGLFQSQRIGGVQNAADQTDAAWLSIANTPFYYNGISAIDNASIPVASPSTVWPFHVADGGSNTFDQSIFQQLNGSSDTSNFAFVPLLFMSNEQGINPSFNTIPLISTFWSDGARRLMTEVNIASSTIPEDLLVLPFDTLEWDIDNPTDAKISDSVLSDIFEILWIKQIGVSGQLMLGTNTGIVALS